MIVCPNCNHQNPDGANQCEACYTPLPATTSCPNCGASVQTDASFCGQCGFNLNVSGAQASLKPSAPTPLPTVPDWETPDPLATPGGISMSTQAPDPDLNPTTPPLPDPKAPLPATMVGQPLNLEESTLPPPPPPEPAKTPPSPPPTMAVEAETSPPVVSAPPPQKPAAAPGVAKTQLQIPSAKLLHLQTNNLIELPLNLPVIHIGKPNDHIPPDIDVSGFPNSEIVSRIHADIRVEGDAYFIEDVGSSNGTYINHNPLPQGNRHRLRTGDRISLGKGDQVTFLFQSS